MFFEIQGYSLSNLVNNTKLQKANYTNCEISHKLNLIEKTHLLKCCPIPYNPFMKNMQMKTLVKKGGGDTKKRSGQKTYER